MKLKLSMLIIIVFGCFTHADTLYIDEYVINPTLDSTSANGYYIPVNIEDCFIELDHMLPEGLIAEIRDKTEKDLTEYHFSLGVMLRTIWNLWGETRLAEYFRELEIFHPDDMSMIIITSYYRYLNDQPIELDQQIEYYLEYWENIRQSK
jgi:hypothetical protein